MPTGVNFTWAKSASKFKGSHDGSQKKSYMAGRRLTGPMSFPEVSGIPAFWPINAATGQQVFKVAGPSYFKKGGEAFFGTREEFNNIRGYAPKNKKYFGGLCSIRTSPPAKKSKKSTFSVVNVFSFGETRDGWTAVPFNKADKADKQFVAAWANLSLTLSESYVEEEEEESIAVPAQQGQETEDWVSRGLTFHERLVEHQQLCFELCRGGWATVAPRSGVATATKRQKRRWAFKIKKNRTVAAKAEAAKAVRIAAKAAAKNRVEKRAAIATAKVVRRELRKEQKKQDVARRAEWARIKAESERLYLLGRTRREENRIAAASRKQERAERHEAFLLREKARQERASAKALKLAQREERARRSAGGGGRHKSCPKVQFVEPRAQFSSGSNGPIPTSEAWEVNSGVEFVSKMVPLWPNPEGTLAYTYYEELTRGLEQEELDFDPNSTCLDWYDVCGADAMMFGHGYSSDNSGDGPGYFGSFNELPILTIDHLAQPVFINNYNSMFISGSGSVVQPTSLTKSPSEQLLDNMLDNGKPNYDNMHALHEAMGLMTKNIYVNQLALSLLANVIKFNEDGSIDSDTDTYDLNLVKKIMTGPIGLVSKVDATVKRNSLCWMNALNNFFKQNGKNVEYLSGDTYSNILVRDYDHVSSSSIGITKQLASIVGHHDVDPIYKNNWFIVLVNSDERETNHIELARRTKLDYFSLVTIRDRCPDVPFYSESNNSSREEMLVEDIAQEKLEESVRSESEVKMRSHFDKKSLLYLDGSTCTYLELSDNVNSCKICRGLIPHKIMLRDDMCCSESDKVNMLKFILGEITHKKRVSKDKQLEIGLKVDTKVSKNSLKKTRQKANKRKLEKLCPKCFAPNGTDLCTCNLSKHDETIVALPGTIPSDQLIVKIVENKPWNMWSEIFIEFKNYTISDIKRSLREKHTTINPEFYDCTALVKFKEHPREDERKLAYGFDFDTMSVTDQYKDRTPGLHVTEVGCINHAFVVTGSDRMKMKIPSQYPNNFNDRKIDPVNDIQFEFDITKRLPTDMIRDTMDLAIYRCYSDDYDFEFWGYGCTTIYMEMKARNNKALVRHLCYEGSRGRCYVDVAGPKHYVATANVQALPDNQSGQKLLTLTGMIILYGLPEELSHVNNDFEMTLDNPDVKITSLDLLSTIVEKTVTEVNVEGDTVEVIKTEVIPPKVDQSSLPDSKLIGTTFMTKYNNALCNILINKSAVSELLSEGAIKFFVENGFSTKPYRSVLTKKNPKDDKWYVDPTDLVIPGWSAEFKGVKTKDHQYGKSIFNMDLGSFKTEDHVAWSGFVKKQMEDFNDNKDMINKSKVASVSLTITRDAIDYPYYKELSNLQYRITRSLRDKHVGFKSKQILKNMTEEAKLAYKKANTSVQKLGEQMAVFQCLRCITFKDVTNRAVELKHLATVAFMMSRFLWAVSFSCGIDPSLLKLRNLRLSDVGKDRTFLHEKLFDKVITDLKTNHQCKRFVNDPIHGAQICDRMWCESENDCLSALKKRINWLRYKARSNSDDNGESDSDSSTKPKLKRVVTPIPEDMGEIYSGLELGTYRTYSDTEMEDYLKSCKFFGIYMNGAQRIIPMDTCDTITGDRTVTVGAKADVDSIKVKKAKKQLEIAERKSIKIEKEIATLKSKIDLSAKGTLYASPKFIDNAEKVLSLMATGIESEFRERVEETSLSFNDVIKFIEDGVVKMLHAGSVVEQSLTEKDLDKKMILTVKGINNTRISDKTGEPESDNACWAHSYSVLQALKSNPDTKDGDIHLIEPSGPVSLDKGLSANAMVEHYGLDWENTAYYLNGDFRSLSQGWYGGDPLTVDNRFYLSVQNQGNDQFLHCEPITEIDVDVDGIVDFTDVSAGAIGEGLVIQAAPSVLPVIGEIPRSDTKPQMIDTQDATKFGIPKSLGSEAMAGSSNPVTQMFLKYAAPHLEFRESMSQYSAKVDDYQRVIDNNVYPAVRAIRPADNIANQLNNRIELDRISFSTPASLLQLNGAKTAFEQVAVPLKYYRVYTDLSFHTIPALSMAEVTTDLQPKKSGAVMAVFEAESAYPSLAENRQFIAKFVTRLSALKGTPGSHTAYILSSLFEINLRGTNLDINIMSFVGGVVPRLGSIDQPLGYCHKVGFVWNDANGDVRPDSFPLMKEESNGVRRHFSNKQYYNDEGATVPCAVVPTWMAAQFFQGSYHGDKGTYSIGKAIERISKAGGAQVHAAGGFPVADVEATLRALNPQFVVGLVWYDVAGIPIAGNAIDLLPLTVGMRFAGWGSAAITPATAAAAGGGADVAMTSGYYQRFFKAIDEIIEIRRTLSVGPGTGDMFRQLRLKHGLAKYELLDEFDNLDGILPVYVSNSDLLNSRTTLAQVVGSMPKPWFLTKRTASMHTPSGGFTSYVNGQPIVVTQADIAHDVDFMANIQQMAIDTGKRAVMIIVGGVNEGNFTSNMDWFGPVRAVPAGRDQACGVNGNLNKFLLPFKSMFYGIDQGVLDWRTQFADNEGINSDLWDTAQNINQYVEDNYLSLSSTSAIKALDRLLNRGATEDELRYCLWMMASVTGQSGLLPHVGPNHDLFNPHVLQDEPTRLRVLGRRATGFASRQALRNANGTVLNRPDLVGAFKLVTNAVGMSAYSTNDGADVSKQNKQYTVGTLRGIVDFGIELGYVELPSMKEWEGIALFEARAYISSSWESSRQMTMVIDKLMDWTGKSASDMLEMSHNARPDNDDMYLQQFWLSGDSPQQMVMSFFDGFFPKQIERNFKSCIFARELQHRGNEVQLIVDGYLGKTFKRIPRLANHLYSEGEQAEVRFRMEESDMEPTTFGNNNYLRWKIFEQEETDKERPLISALPWKYSHNNVMTNEITRSGLFLYKQENPDAYEISLQMSGTEDKILSFLDMVSPDIAGIYGFTSREVIEQAKQCLISAGYGTIMNEYRFTPFTPGVPREYRIGSTQTHNFLRSLEGARRIINVSSEETLTSRTDNVYYVADYKKTRSGFTF